MEYKMEFNSGMLRIHGEIPGESMDISRLLEESICVLLLNAMHTHLSIDLRDSRKFCDDLIHKLNKVL
jgi:hypothetical protein